VHGTRAFLLKGGQNGGVAPEHCAKRRSTARSAGALREVRCEFTGVPRGASQRGGAQPRFRGEVLGSEA
jgi:hypothetical protein